MSKPSLLRRAAIFVAAASFLVACGGSAPPPQAPEPAPEPEAKAPEGPGLQMSAELGSIDQDAVQRTFDGLTPKLQDCYKSGRKRLEFLGGDVKFFLRVDQQGKAKYGYLEETTLGDRETEQCMVGIVMAAQWPKPVGGEAEVRTGIGFDAPGDVRAPTSWSGDKLAEVLGKHQDDFAKCKKGVSGSFKVTAYIEGDGKHGKVMAAGSSVPNKDAAEKVDCLLDAVKDMKKLPSPGSYPAKVDFVL